MRECKTDQRSGRIEQEYELREPPQKVWRAISIPELRESWLPAEAFAEPEATSIKPGQEVSYRLRENAPPFLESTVTFQIAPDGTGGTRLRILHELMDGRLKQATKAAANNNGPPLMLAA